MNGRNDHLSAERLQAFLDGELPAKESARVEEHLAACARCSAELDGWRVLFTDLGALSSRRSEIAPHAGFADRVMARVTMPEPERRWLASLLPSRPKHLSADVLQDVADGLLGGRRARNAHAHLAACSTCARELEAWQRLVSTLDRVDHLAPSADFAARVMAKVRMPSTVPVAVRAPAPVRKPAWDRALAVARRMVPRTRRAWATVSGVAVTPAVIFGLMVYAVFSHPTLTPQALASFAAWQIADLFAAGWNAVVVTGFDIASAVGAGSLLERLTGAPALVAGIALAYSAAAALALRVLYKTLIANRRYASVSTR